MQLHLDEIAKDIEPGRHAVLMLDKAGPGFRREAQRG
jgi:hypothetical protein